MAETASRSGATHGLSNQGCSYHEEKRMKLSSAALAFILFTIPCLAQQNAATIELGRASIRIGMPQDKAISALAAEGFILKKMGTQYIVGRIGRTGQTSREGRVSFVGGGVLRLTETGV